MVIKLSDYILEQSISDASVDNIELERLFAEMNVKLALVDALLKGNELIQEGIIGTDLSTNLAKVGAKWGSGAKNITGSAMQMGFLTLDIVIALFKTCKNAMELLDQQFNYQEFSQYQQVMDDISKDINEAETKAEKKHLKKERMIITGKHLVSSAKTSMTFLKHFINFINPLKQTRPEAQQAVDQYYGRIQTSINAMITGYETPAFSGTSTVSAEDFSQLIAGMISIQKEFYSSEFKNVKEFFEKTDINTLKSELNETLKGFDPKYLANINASLKRASAKAQNMVRDFSKYVKENKVEMVYMPKKNLNQMNNKQIPVNYANLNKKDIK